MKPQNIGQIYLKRINMEEIFKDVVGYEGLYRISNYGKIINRHGKLRKHIKESFGYMIVTLCKNSSGKRFYIHRLIAIHFIPNPLNLPMINHLDSDRSNNSIENLEWCDAVRNQRHSWENGRINPIKGKKRNNYERNKKWIKEVIQLSKEGQFIKKWESVLEASLALGIDKGNISKCCNNKLKTAGGFKWEYAERN